MPDIDDLLNKRKKQESQTLYKEQRIFTEDYAPESTQEVLFRDEEIEKIVDVIWNTAKPKKVRSDLFIFGVAGIGKTYTVKAVLNDVSKRLGDKYKSVWVNCKNLRPLTEFQIMNEISEQLGNKFDKGYATKDIERYIEEYHEGMHEGKPLLIVFDEADALVNAPHKRNEDNLTRILYTLYEKQINLILLSNVFNWIEHLCARTKSRLTINQRIFGNYSVEQIKEILKSLADKGLKKDVMSEKIISKIADQCDNIYAGDLRKAKILVAKSVDIAIREGVKTVTKEHLKKASQEVKMTSLVNILKKYAKQQQLALAGFLSQMVNHNDSKHGGMVFGGKRNPATTDNIYYFYKKCCELNDVKPVEKAMMKNYLEALKLNEILQCDTKSYSEIQQRPEYDVPRRGRTNVYYTDYDIIELGNALVKLGIKFPPTGREWGSKKEHAYFSPDEGEGET